MPNVLDTDYTPGFVHWRPEQMPIRVYVHRPGRTPPQIGEEEAVGEFSKALLKWEIAVHPRLPWMRFELVDDRATADFTVRWNGSEGWWNRSHPSPHPWLQYRLDGAPKLAGEVLVSIVPRFFWAEGSYRVDFLEQVGHMLGLGHTETYASVMNEIWAEDERNQASLVPTASDIETLCDLHLYRSGFREDGTPLRSLVAKGWTPPPPDVSARCQ